MSELKYRSEKHESSDKEDKKQEINRNIGIHDWQSYAKVSELIISATCLGLALEPAKKEFLGITHLGQFALIFATCIGYLLITSIYLVAKLIGDKIPFRTGFISSVLGSGLFFAVGVLLALIWTKQRFRDEIIYYTRPHILRMLITSSAFAIFNSIIFGAEAVYIWRNCEDF